jgi:hypothetical protein
MAHARTESRGHEPDTSIHRANVQPAPDTEHERLDAFVGKWHMEGQQIAGPAGAAATISAIETYEWLSGGQFLIHRFDGHIGNTEAACIEIIGFEPERRCYRAHSFYNNGHVNVWDLEHRDGQWRFLGDWNAGGRSMKVRCTTTFGADGQTMQGKWEHSNDGSSWQTFWEVSARRVTDH